MTPCPIPNCPNKIPPHAIVCVEHWAKVPVSYQRQVLIRRNQVARAVNGKSAACLTAAMRLYRQACQVAVAAVMPKEHA